MNQRLLPLFALFLISHFAFAADSYVYFGTQSAAPNTGISLAIFHPDTGQLDIPKLTIATNGPSFFAVQHNRKYIYSTNYTTDGGVSAFAIDPANGSLKLLNHISGDGAGSSHVSLDATDHWLLAANFAKGHIVTFRIQPDGSIGKKVANELHTGSSVNPVRQKTTYPHEILTDPTNRFALIPDLGLDKVFTYQFNANTGMLTANDPAFVNITPGSGPRHICFSPDHKFVYLLSEMGGTVTVLRWDSGKLTQQQSISTLPADFHGENTSSEITLSPSGKFLYAGNRGGSNTIAIFAIGPDGNLTAITHVPTGGKTPRDFAEDPSGKFLLVTNQDSDTAVIFRIEDDGAKLTPVGKPVSVPAPCGICFVEQAAR